MIQGFQPLKVEKVIGAVLIVISVIVSGLAWGLLPPVVQEAAKALALFAGSFILAAAGWGLWRDG